MSVLSFALFVVTLAVALFSQHKKWKLMLLASASPFVAYYVYRILFSMCNASLSV